jgi:hypothetical protein
MAPMAKLIVNPTSASRREILLPRSVLSIGRDPSNDVVLPDAMVSRRHAVVEYRGSQYFIRDCNSSNGSLVNGDRVSERSLRDGDLVAIGTARLLFRDDLDLEDAGAKVVQHPSAPRLSCQSCNADYRKGDLFCRQCGTALAPAAPVKAVCSACGTAVSLPARFCPACGRPLTAEAAAPAPGPSAANKSPSGGGAAQAAALSEPAPGADASLPESSLEIAIDQAPRELGPDPTPLKLEPERSEEARGLPEEPKALGPRAPTELPRKPTPTPRSAPLPTRPRTAAPLLSSPLWQDHPAQAAKGARAAQAAGFGPRCAAGLIDLALVVAVDALLLAPVFLYWWGRELPREASQVPFLPILLSMCALPMAAGLTGFYFVHGWGVLGATFGKRLLGLAVEGEHGAYPIGTARALVRLLGYCASGLLLGLGFVLIALTGEGLHDRIAGTRVVRRGAD